MYETKPRTRLIDTSLIFQPRFPCAEHALGKADQRFMEF
jgi:hypothetical protein